MQHDATRRRAGKARGVELGYVPLRCTTRLLTTRRRRRRRGGGGRARKASAHVPARGISGSAPCSHPACVCPTVRATPARVSGVRGRLALRLLSTRQVDTGQADRQRSAGFGGDGRWEAGTRCARCRSTRATFRQVRTGRPGGSTHQHFAGCQLGRSELLLLSEDVALRRGPVGGTQREHHASTASAHGAQHGALPPARARLASRR